MKEQERTEELTEWAVASGGTRPGIDGTLSLALSEEQARRWCAESPGTRVLRRRVLIGPWQRSDATPTEETK